jgi:hypothetical protein
VARAHGWYGYWLTPDDVATSLAGLRSAADRVERPSELGELGELEISMTPRGGVTPEQAVAYAELGVHRLVLLPPPTPEGPAATIDAAAAAVDGLE